MEYIDDEPVLEMDEVVSYIEQNSDLDADTIEKVLNLETDFMIKVGIIKAR